MDSNKKRDSKTQPEGARLNKTRLLHFRSTIFSDLRDIKEFYLSDEQKSKLDNMKPVAGSFFLLGWLLKSLVLKLTPIRRFILVLAIVLLVISVSTISFGGAYFRIDFKLLGAVLLIFILMLELKDKLLAKSELAEGRSIQTRLFPDPSPDIPGWDAWLYSRPANDVGGDLLDCICLVPNHYALVLGDVSGKGLPAALLMAKLQATTRALANESTPLSQLGAQINRIFHRDGISSSFATLVVLDLDSFSGRVKMLNAGHTPPLLLRGGQVEITGKGDAALGLAPDSAYRTTTLEMQPGDLLLVYSDGINESRTEKGDFYGNDRLMRLLPDLSALPVADVGTRILAAVQEFIGDARPDDDQTVLILRRLA